MCLVQSDRGSVSQFEADKWLKETLLKLNGFSATDCQSEQEGDGFDSVVSVVDYQSVYSGQSDKNDFSAFDCQPDHQPDQRDDIHTYWQSGQTTLCSNSSSRNSSVSPKSYKVSVGVVTVCLIVTSVLMAVRPNGFLVLLKTKF